ncbi:hypothetical protein ABZ478_33550 [Streptomyces sp. NPDC005706]|uniref:hypothetical protein n=1 Tax=Streptomyces sp. NPDC005706 TaxID=3157169 RepID=UPI0033E225FF
MSEHAGYAGIVYWRRSLWNGARCVPVVLSLVPDELRAQDRDGQVVFRGDPRKADGRLTRLGTLVINVEGKRYALVGRGSDLSPAPTSGQHAAVSGFRPPSDVSGGAFDQIMNGGAMARMRAWHTWLGGAGARLR